MTKLNTPGSQGDNDPLITTGCMILSAQTCPIGKILSSVETEGETVIERQGRSGYDRLPAKQASALKKTDSGYDVMQDNDDLCKHKMS